MSYQEQLNTLEKKIESQKIHKAKLEERLSNIEKEEAKLKKEVNIEDLDKEIQTLEEDIKRGIEQCENLLK